MISFWEWWSGVDYYLALAVGPAELDVEPAKPSLLQNFPKSLGLNQTWCTVALYRKATGLPASSQFELA